MRRKDTSTTCRVCPQCSAQNSSQNTTCDSCNASLEGLPEVTTSSGWSHWVTDAEKQIKTSRNILFVLAAVNLVIGLIGYVKTASSILSIAIVGGAVYGVLGLLLRLQNAVTVSIITAVLLSLDLISCFVFAHPTLVDWNSSRYLL
jgi:uncharacterized membrane protein (UPF0136 family)